MKQIYQQSKEVVVWLYQSAFTVFANGATWDIVTKDKDRRLTKLPLGSLGMFHHPWFMRVWVLQEVAFARDITVLFQRDDKRIVHTTWDEALDFGIGYLDRYKHDDRNTSVAEIVELSIAMMMAMDDWRGKVERDIFNLTLRNFCRLQDSAALVIPKTRSSLF